MTERANARPSLLLALLLLGAGGCAAVPAVYGCSSDADCGGAGRCQATGWCSFPDSSCKESGYRYGSAAGGGLSGGCVGGGTLDASTDVCPSGETPCGSVCVDLAGDSANCGNCGAVCDPQTPVCSSGRCISPPMPTRRAYFAAAFGPDERIYALGGVGQTGPLATVEAYSPGAMSWAIVTPVLPTPRGHLAGVVVGPSIYTVGGIGASGTTGSCEAYAPASGHWTILPPLPTPRSDLAAVTGPDGRLYAIGGLDTSGAPVDVVEAFSPPAGAWDTSIARLGTRRAGLAAAVGPDGRIWAIGGWNASGPVTAVEAYAPGAATWDAGVPQLSFGRRDLAAVTNDIGFGPNTFVVGGTDDMGKYLGTLESTSASATSWAAARDMPTPRAGLAFIAVPGIPVILAIGGDDGHYLSAVEVYAPRTGVW